MMDAIGVALIAFVLALNLARTEALIVLGASTVLSLALWRRWVARGRPSGVAQAARLAAALERRVSPNFDDASDALIAEAAALILGLISLAPTSPSRGAVPARWNRRIGAALRGSGLRSAGAG